MSFAVTAAFARREGAAILLRIDDLDRDRVNPEYIEDIFETLRFLQIPWDEGPHDPTDFGQHWSQVRRLELYRAALGELRAAGLLFACDCSRSQVRQAAARGEASHASQGEGRYPGTCRSRGLSLETPGCNWRIRTDGSGLPEEMTDFVVRKKDGNPAYQLTSVIDDLHLGVDRVVRGEDLRASTEAQQWLAKKLGRTEFDRILFVHHPLLADGEHAKMSKSSGAGSVQFLRRNGVKPAEVFRQIAQRAGADFMPCNWSGLGEGLIALWALHFPQ